MTWCLTFDLDLHNVRPSWMLVHIVKIEDKCLGNKIKLKRHEHSWWIKQTVCPVEDMERCSWPWQRVGELIQWLEILSWGTWDLRLGVGEPRHKAKKKWVVRQLIELSWKTNTRGSRAHMRGWRAQGLGEPIQVAKDPNNGWYSSFEGLKAPKSVGRAHIKGQRHQQMLEQPLQGTKDPQKAWKIPHEGPKAQIWVWRAYSRVQKPKQGMGEPAQEAKDPNVR